MATFLFLFKNPDHHIRAARLVSLVNPCSCLRCTSPRNPFSSRYNTEANSSDSFSEKTISGPRLQELATPRICSTEDIGMQNFSAADRAETPFFLSFLLYLILRNSSK